MCLSNLSNICRDSACRIDSTLCDTRQNLVAKNVSGRLYDSLTTVTRAVNTIKARAFNSRLLRQLCAENDEEFEQLLLHTEVR